MAQQVKLLAAKSDDLRLILRPIRQKDSTDSWKLFLTPQVGMEVSHGHRQSHGRDGVLDKVQGSAKYQENHTYNWPTPKRDRKSKTCSFLTHKGRTQQNLLAVCRHSHACADYHRKRCRTHGVKAYSGNRVIGHSQLKDGSHLPQGSFPERTGELIWG